MEPVTMAVVAFVAGAGAAYGADKISDHYEDKNPEKVYNRVSNDLLLLRNFAQREEYVREGYATFERARRLEDARAAERSYGRRQMSSHAEREEEEDYYANRYTRTRGTQALPARTRTGTDTALGLEDLLSRIGAVEQKCAQLESENVQLHSENARLITENVELRASNERLEKRLLTPVRRPSSTPTE